MIAAIVADRTTPNVDAFTSVSVSVRPQRSAAPPNVTVPSVLFHVAPADLFVPLTVPPFTNLTTESKTELGAPTTFFLSNETETPLIVAPLGIAKPKFVAFR